MQLSAWASPQGHSEAQTGGRKIVLGLVKPSRATAELPPGNSGTIAHQVHALVPAKQGNPSFYQKTDLWL